MTLVCVSNSNWASIVTRFCMRAIYSPNRSVPIWQIPSTVCLHSVEEGLNWYPASGGDAFMRPLQWHSDKSRHANKKAYKTKFQISMSLSCSLLDTKCAPYLLHSTLDFLAVQEEEKKKKKKDTRKARPTRGQWMATTVSHPSSNQLKCNTLNVKNNNYCIWRGFFLSWFWIPASPPKTNGG